MHIRKYDIREIVGTAGIVYQVISRNFGSEGGWHVLKSFYTKEEAEKYIFNLL